MHYFLSQNYLQIIKQVKHLTLKSNVSGTLDLHSWVADTSSTPSLWIEALTVIGDIDLNTVTYTLYTWPGRTVLEAVIKYVLERKNIYS